MRLSFFGLLGLAVLSLQNSSGVFGFEGTSSASHNVCLTENLFYNELIKNRGKNINIDSLYRLIPPGNEKFIFHFEQSKACALDSVQVPLSIGLHRPQKLTLPINRSVSASTAQIYLNEEYYINRYIEYTINTVDFPSKIALVGVCILYSFRNVRNQLGEFSALPDIHKVAAASLQLPQVSDSDDFRNSCIQYLISISKIPRNHSSKLMIALVCKQIPKCVKDTNMSNSLSSLREILVNDPATLSVSNSLNKILFIENIRNKFNGRPLNEGLLRLYRIVSKLDSIVTTHFDKTSIDVFGNSDEKQTSSWHNTVIYGYNGSSDNISCEESLILHFKAHPLILGKDSASKRSHLSSILCNYSEQAINPIFIPTSPNSILFQYLMYLNEHLELPIELISCSMCVFHLSASYTGMYPEFDLATRLAVFLEGYISAEEKFMQTCMEALPKFINLSENTFISGERVIVDLKKDSNSICSAIKKCFESKMENVLTNEELTALMLSVLPLSSENENFPQILHRSKFIHKIFDSKVEKVDLEERIEKLNKTQLKGIKGLLTPSKAIKEVMKTLNYQESKYINGVTALEHSELAIKTQKLYSSLLRVALILLEKVRLPRSKTNNCPISNPNDIVEEKNLQNVVISVKYILEIVSNSLTPHECAESVLNKRSEYLRVYDTVLAICESVLFTSYPNSFSELPYLVKLVVVASDNYGFSFNQLKRIYAYASSSFSVLGLQLKLHPLFAHICRFGSYDNHKKSEYNICMENFQFSSFFSSSQIQGKQKLFCTHVSKMLNDSYYDRIVSFSLKNFAKKSISEENWIKNTTDISMEIKDALNEVVGISFQKGSALGEANKYSAFFVSKFIRRIQRSRYFGELTGEDLKVIFVNMYSNFEQIPVIGSSSFAGNALRYEFILARDSSADMHNSRYISDNVFGLRSILFNDILFEKFSYLIRKCSQVLLKFFEFKSKTDINEKEVGEICSSTFSLPNNELPTQVTDRPLFIKYLVNYFSIPKQIIPKLYCIYKKVRKYSRPITKKPSFEATLNFGLHLINLTRGFKNSNDPGFIEKCNIASLLSNILNMNSETVVYDENASTKTYKGLSLSYHDENPIDHRLIGYFCSDIQVCSDNYGENSIYKYISLQTNYDLIFTDNLNGDPLNTLTQSSEQLSSDKNNTTNLEAPLFKFSNSKFTQKLEQLIENYIFEGVEIKDNYDKTVKVRGIRTLEAIRLFGVFHDSFLSLLKSKNPEKDKSLINFTGLYSGSNPIKGVNDINDNFEVFPFYNSIKVVDEISKIVISNSQLNGETSSLVLSKNPRTIQICSDILKSYLPEGFDSLEIESICTVSFSPFKY
ncbi:hypothetical protein FG386_000156 [Cryptosporidium ryanae]|uniref:uncharacterized protein n=1 Tax=Cryptosporidium ryanae TaxID=515981 RepID=UPI003519E2E3|nr:hypothetical protein FG386_000156 [Cryptosporidium ryanae]